MKTGRNINGIIVDKKTKVVDLVENAVNTGGSIKSKDGHLKFTTKKGVEIDLLSEKSSKYEDFNKG